MTHRASGWPEGNLMRDNGTPQSDSRPLSADVQSPRVVAGRYEILHVLKQGNGIETLQGTDRVDHQSVIIKTAADGSLSVGAAMRLEHEANVLRQVRGLG